MINYKLNFLLSSSSSFLSSSSSSTSGPTPSKKEQAQHLLEAATAAGIRLSADPSEARMECGKALAQNQYDETQAFAYLEQTCGRRVQPSSSSSSNSTAGGGAAAEEDKDGDEGPEPLDDLADGQSVVVRGSSADYTLSRKDRIYYCTCTVRLPPAFCQPCFP